MRTVDVRWRQAPTRVAIALLLVAMAVPALAASTPASPRAPACYEDWWRGRLADARAHRTTPEALLPLREASEMARTAADPTLVQAALDEMRALPDTHPLVAAEIDAILLAADLDLGRFDSAAARRARLGAVTKYLVAGPFDGAAPPAGWAADLARPAGELSRFRALETGPDAELPLAEVMYPATRTNAIAVFYLRATRVTPVAIRYGADDRASVDLDGTALARPEGQHDMGFDQHAAFATLQPGWHRVALLVEQDDGAWGVTARVTAPDGRPLDGSAVSLEMPADRAAAERELSAPGRFAPAEGTTITAWLEQQAKSGDPRAMARLAQDLSSRGLPDRKDSRAVTLARQAVAAAPRDVDVQWVRALVDSDPAQRREALEHVLEVDPTHPGALRRLAGYHLEYGRIDASIEEARRSMRACGKPDPYLAGWEALARDNRAFPAGALATLTRLVDENPHQVALLDRLASLCRHEGLVARSRRLMERFLALEQENDRARGDYVAVLLESGDPAAARKVVLDRIAHAPLDMSWRSRLVRSYLVEGQPDRAQQAAREALALSPNNPTLLELLGQTQLAAGDQKGATATWKQALAVAQDPGTLGERISALTGADDTFGSEWTVTLDAARAIEARQHVEGDPAALVLSKTAAYRVRADGLSSRFQQVMIRVVHPDQAAFARSVSFSYSPSLEQATIVAARLIRKDGATVLAARSDRPLLPDPEIRMWYDSRVVELTFPRLEEGDLVDVRWRVTDRGPGNPIGDGYFGDIWSAGEEVPVLSARLVFDSPKERPLRFQLAHLPSEPTIRRSTRDGRDLTIVELPQLPAYQGAPLAPPPTARLPYAVIGTVTDWASLGRMYSKLLSDQAVAGPDVEAVVRQVTAKATTREEKIRALYDWVIENTRYVALELGIHAIKPYDVPSVFRRRFGDCKDKATLLMTMLREAGIDSRVALVRTRDRGPVDTTVPTFAAFDHAIVYVPGEKLWLDGTVQHHAMGEVPAPDRNALALLVSASGEPAAELTRIPEMAPSDSLASREEEIAVDAEGAARIGVRVTARGDEAGRERGYFRQTDRPGVVLANRLRRAFPDLVLVDSHFDAVGLDQDAVLFGYTAQVDRFARREGAGLSVPLGLVIPELPVERPDPDRKLPVELPSPFERRLTSRIVFPAGYTAQELPRGESLETPWGTVNVDVRQTVRGVDVSIDLSFRGGTVPIDRIGEFAGFVERASHALEGRIVLRKL